MFREPVPMVAIASAPAHTFFADLSNIMPAAIEAALKVMKHKLKQQFYFCMRTQQSLHAEFVAFSAKEKHDMMTSGTADAKRLRWTRETLWRSRLKRFE